MGGEENGTIGSAYGSITDINIWNKYFSSEDIDDFHSCREIQHRKILDWGSLERDIQVKGYVWKNEKMERICPKIQIEEKIVIGQLNMKSFEEMITFCDKAFNARINVLQNFHDFGRMVEEINFLETETYFFTGYRRDLSKTEQQHFIDIYDNSPMPNFTWGQNQPNNVGGKQDCVYFEPKKNTIFDLECSSKYSSLCQIKDKTVFQLSGFCSHIDLDSTYILSTVS